MNSFDHSYKALIGRVLDRGVLRTNRTGFPNRCIFGETISHDLSEGFPLTTLRNIPIRLIASELDFYLKGLTDKRWLQERDNHIWDKFANSQKVKYGRDAEERAKMELENDLGPIYGFQWRHFGAEYRGSECDYTGEGIDQIKRIIERIKRHPDSKSLVVSGWNPAQIEQMAVPLCPFAFQIIRFGDQLNLSFFQRSIDCMVGLPFDFAQYALLLHLLALETNLKPGKVIGFFTNVEIFSSHEEGARELLTRDIYPLPMLRVKDFKGLDEWSYTDVVLENYQSNDRLKFEVVV
jgi:thymidylate synthase